jgi:hypothetical protein
MPFFQQQKKRGRFGKKWGRFGKEWGRFDKKWGRFGKVWGRFGKKWGRFVSGGVLTCYLIIDTIYFLTR